MRLEPQVFFFVRIRLSKYLKKSIHATNILDTSVHWGYSYEQDRFYGATDVK